ncbi:MAG: Gfo/Idh/MocA family oxidoreductase [Chitinophagales bacterium]|nr:Gfo/Idh/MocA family oxidoreductase [Chitinophagales bacterium]
MKNFSLIGASGYIAPRHLRAIKNNQGQLLAAYDPFDSAGIMDSFFPQADFFTEFERFDRHIDKLKRQGTNLDYVSICSPNYLHDSHIRFGLKNGADVICEKPLVLNPWNVEGLMELEKEMDRKVYNILQLRLHDSIIALKQKVDAAPKDKIFDFDLSYITSRGKWYYASWKGDEQKSGGIATNIGVHFFDMLTWIFGDLKLNQVHLHSFDRAAGYLEFERARVRWFLSINSETLPLHIKEAGKTTYRSMTLEGEEIEFSDGFTDLHDKSYKAILNGNGFRIKEALSAIRIVHEIRNTKAVGLVGDYHPFAKFPLSIHPFHNK